MEQFSIELDDNTFDLLWFAFEQSIEIAEQALRQDGLVPKEVTALIEERDDYKKLQRQLIAQAPELARKRNLV